MNNSKIKSEILNEAFKDLISAKEELRYYTGLNTPHFIKKAMYHINDAMFLILNSEELEQSELIDEELSEQWKNEKKKLQNALFVLINICENNTKLNLSNYKKLIEDMEDEDENK